MTQRLDARIDRYQPAALSVFRIFFGLLFLFEGLSKIFDWPAPYSVPTGSWPVWYAGILELILGTLITIGMFTRVAAFAGLRRPRRVRTAGWPASPLTVSTGHTHSSSVSGTSPTGPMVA
ncbi:MAG: DoxX family protein [Mycolicibacterium aromaticivorans]|nr:DoxX family protein [Mycolicibacterium aromaticivorans]